MPNLRDEHLRELQDREADGEEKAHRLMTKNRAAAERKRKLKARADAGDPEAQQRLAEQHKKILLQRQNDRRQEQESVAAGDPQIIARRERRTVRQRERRQEQREAQLAHGSLSLMQGAESY